tara:strand:- start:359 stop:1066 length:708 start_codon:yes stop_codon:yes gene_type:complete
MAYSNRKQDLFTGLRKPRGKDRFSPMETRGQQDDPIDQSGYGSAPTAPTGQMQAPIGSYSAPASMIGYADWYTDWDNMSDIYDDWSAYNQAQLTWDQFYQNFGQEGNPFGPGSSQYANALADWEQAQADYSTGYDWWNLYGPGSSWNSGGNPMTGGTQGGFGDLGQGSAFDPGFTNPFGEGWGPSGQYGGETSELDPNWNQYGDECLSMWQTFQGQDWTAGQYDSYDDFAADYCG